MEQSLDTFTQRPDRLERENRWSAAIGAATTVFLGLVVFAPVPSQAQMDVPRVLVGKWEGKVHFSGAARGYQDPDRTLLIKSVREQEGKWIANVEFGVRDRLWRPAETTLKVDGEQVNLQFSFPDNTRVELTLEQSNILDGYLWPGKWGGQVTGVQIPLKLKKADEERPTFSR